MKPMIASFGSVLLHFLPLFELPILAINASPKKYFPWAVNAVRIFWLAPAAGSDCPRFADRDDVDASTTSEVAALQKKLLSYCRVPCRVGQHVGWHLTNIRPSRYTSTPTTGLQPMEGNATGRSINTRTPRLCY
jgi:hypothetical protein